MGLPLQMLHLTKWLLLIAILFLITGCFNKQFESSIDIPKDIVITQELVRLEIEKLRANKDISEAEIKGVELLIPSLVSQVLSKYIDFKSKKLENIRYRIVIYKGVGGDFRITLPNQLVEFTARAEKEK